VDRIGSCVDQKPVLGFTGMPLEALGSVFSAPFGPGLGLSGAEVETGFSIPSYVSMGSPRSAGLVYSNRQAYPRALVPVDLELPWPAGTPDQVKLVLIDGVVRMDSVVLATPTCATGAVKRCRSTLQADFSASSFATPTRKWLTVEASVTSEGVTQTGSDSVEVVIVDRRTTRYGSGWWVAGLSQSSPLAPIRSWSALPEPPPSIVVAVVSTRRHLGSLPLLRRWAPPGSSIRGAATPRWSSMRRGAGRLRSIRTAIATR
jgi:hypothetical protein